MFFKGDIVSITTHSSTCASGNDSRDYIQEAVQYFETRLEQYGPGTEVSSCRDQIPTYHKLSQGGIETWEVQEHN